MPPFSGNSSLLEGTLYNRTGLRIRGQHVLFEQPPKRLPTGASGSHFNTVLPVAAIVSGDSESRDGLRAVDGVITALFRVVDLRQSHLSKRRNQQGFGSFFLSSHIEAFFLEDPQDVFGVHYGFPLKP